MIKRLFKFTFFFTALLILVLTVAPLILFDKKDVVKLINQKVNEIEIYVQIESKKGLKNCKEIFSKNINGYFIGPYDLSASLNNPGKFLGKEIPDFEPINTSWDEKIYLVESGDVIEISSAKDNVVIFSPKKTHNINLNKLQRKRGFAPI